MMRALSTSATGLEAQQANIERLSNDIANVNTDAYKRGRNEFQDLMYETTRAPGSAIGAGSTTPVGVQTGIGVKVGAAHKIFEQGPAKITNRPYDLMIEGKGFFPVQSPTTGEIFYTRNGAFKLDAQGKLQTSAGMKLIPEITIPSNAMIVTVTGNGEVKAQLPNDGETVIGNIQLMGFVNEEGLSAYAGGLYRPTPASGQATQGVPSENGFGAISQGAVEASNVNIANSMVEMIGTQRAYEMGTKVMNVADQMLQATTNIK